MTARVTSVGTLISSDFYTTANNADAAGGWIQRVAATSNQGSITTAADLTGLAFPSFTVPARRYLFIASLTFFGTNANETMKVLLLEDGTTIREWDFGLDTFAQYQRLMFSYAPTNAAHVYKLQASRSGTSTGTITLQASSTQPAQFEMHDVGPQ